MGWRRVTVAAGLLLGLLGAPAGSSSGSAGGPPPEEAATTTTEVTLSSSDPPTSAIQKGNGLVEITGKVTKGARRIRLYEDGVQVAEAGATNAKKKTFVRKSVAVGTHTYAFQVGNNSGWAPTSSTVSVTVVGIPVAPATPVLLQTSDAALTATFAKVPGASKYLVLVDGKQKTTVSPKADVDPVVAKLSGLKLDTAYSVSIVAQNIAGKGPASGGRSMTLYAQMKSPLPPTVADGTAQTGAGTVRVAAKLTKGADTYTLMVDGSPSPAVASKGATTVTFDLTSVAAGTHEYAIKVANTRYTVTSKVLSVDVLGAPTRASDVTVQQTSDTAVRVSFDPGDSARYAKVYIDGALAAETKIAKNTSLASVVVGSLVALSSHNVTVVTSNVVGVAAATAPVAFRLYAALPTTTGVPTATQTEAEAVTIRIGTTVNATSYVLLQDGVAVDETTASGGFATFDVTGLTTGGHYAFQVAAKNPRMRAAPSVAANVTVFKVVDDAPTVTVTPTYLSGNVVSVAIEFSELADTDGYRFYVDHVLTTSRPASVVFTDGVASITLSMSSTTGHTIEVCGYTGAGEGPRNTAEDVDPAP